MLCTLKLLESTCDLLLFTHYSGKAQIQYKFSGKFSHGAGGWLGLILLIPLKFTKMIFSPFAGLLNFSPVLCLALDVSLKVYQIFHRITENFLIIISLQVY